MKIGMKNAGLLKRRSGSKRFSYLDFIPSTFDSLTNEVRGSDEACGSKTRPEAPTAPE